MALPLSVLPTFAAMMPDGLHLNVVTLLSLSLVVGILVDDAIVEIENIVRHLRMGKTPLPGGDGGGRRDRPAVIARHLHAGRGVPAHRLHGRRPGKFFVQFGWTAALAVFFSLVVARMLTPMMAAYILPPPSGAPRAGVDGPAHYMAGWAGACEAPLDDHAGRGAVLLRLCSRWCRCCPPASSRRRPGRRPR